MTAPALPPRIAEALEAYMRAAIKYGEAGRETIRAANDAHGAAKEALEAAIAAELREQADRAMRALTEVARAVTPLLREAHTHETKGCAGCAHLFSPETQDTFTDLAALLAQVDGGNQ